MLLSAELRWFWQGACPATVERWFHENARFPGAPEQRLDRYLPQPGNHEIGIKARGNKQGAEVKALIATVPEPAFGGLAPHFEIWGKWDAALMITDSVDIKKLRWLRAFDVQGLEPVEIPRDAEIGPEQSCHLELTKLEIAGQNGIWWTLGLEALGELAAVEDKLRKLMHHVCIEDVSAEGGALMAYPAWLDRFSASGYHRT
jgi:hypothetical protein